MSTPDILDKLTAQLNLGITTEVQVVYLLAGVRKLIERDKIEEKYSNLKFHCDWALHSKMSRYAAKTVLREFDAAHPLLRGNIELHDLPEPLRSEIDRISKMRSFDKELKEFLDFYGLPPVAPNNDDWASFLHLYAKVIEDIPLVVEVPPKRKSKLPIGSPRNISHVIVNCEEAATTFKDGSREVLLFQINWTIYDKAGACGSICILNSFCLRE